MSDGSENYDHPPTPVPTDLPLRATGDEPEPATREQLMARMRKQGATLDVIGTEFGVSRERVRQIISSVGGPTKEDARTAKAERAQAAADTRRAEFDLLIRPLLDASGAMTVQEVAERLNLPEDEIAECWPGDLAHLRIRTGYTDNAWTDEVVFQAIREAATYEFPLTAKAYTELVRAGQVRGPSLPRVHQRYGGWAAACDAAGVEHGQTPRASYNTRWTDAELLAYAREYLLDPDWPNSAHRFDDWRRAKAPDAPSFQTLRNRLGTWSNVKRLALRPGDSAK